MSNWPHDIPPDLRQALDELGGRRDAPRPSDTWGAVREWLVKHEVPVPGDLPSRSEIDTDVGH